MTPSWESSFHCRISTAWLTPTFAHDHDKFRHPLRVIPSRRSVDTLCGDGKTHLAANGFINLITSAIGDTLTLMNKFPIGTRTSTAIRPGRLLTMLHTANRIIILRSPTMRLPTADAGRLHGALATPAFTRIILALETVVNETADGLARIGARAFLRRRFTHTFVHHTAASTVTFTRVMQRCPRLPLTTAHRLVIIATSTRTRALAPRVNNTLRTSTTAAIPRDRHCN